MIEKTKSYVQEKYTIANGYEFDSKVIYGDTDSVMVRFGTKDIAEAMRLGKEAADFVSSHFIKPIKLEFEKVYCPYLLMNKKRYAGILWTKPDNFDKMDTKGLETVRRDNCQLTREVVKKCLDFLLIEKNEHLAIDYCKGIISDVLQNRVDLSMLVITKGLGKKINEEKDEKKPNGAVGNNKGYQNKSAHQNLAEKMRKRCEANAPQQGDRIAYVMIQQGKGSKGFEKSEDPLFALENGLPIDTQYYLDNQLKQPLLRIFDAVLGEKAESTLFKGDHTRSV